MGTWVLEEKQGVKYFQLHFSEKRLKNLQCLFITRVGGLSFNAMGPELFKQNLQWVQENFSIGQINLLRQIHSDEIFYLSENFKENYYLKGDGLFTDQPNLYLGVRVADCLPIYLFAPEKKIIGIVHSGRHGTLKLIIRKIINEIKTKFNIDSSAMYYAFGPCIGGCCYEVSSEVIEQFNDIFKEYQITNTTDFRNNKYYLNIKQINQQILEKMGITKIGDIRECSFCHKDLFYSARRDNSTKRNLAVIGYQQ